MRTTHGNVGNILDPPFRKISFDGETFIVIVSSQLRYAWTANPPESDNFDNAVWLFARENHQRTEEERAAVPQDPDRKTLHTPWRDAIYNRWNHVFSDVMWFLETVNDNIGHFHFPSHDVLPLNFPQPVLN